MKPGPKPKGERRVRRIRKDSTAIVCPLCGATTQVIDSRRSYDNGVRRRRMCTNLDCDYRFTTREILLDDLANKNDRVCLIRETKLKKLLENLEALTLQVRSILDEKEDEIEPITLQELEKTEEQKQTDERFKKAVFNPLLRDTLKETP